MRGNEENNSEYDHIFKLLNEKVILSKEEQNRIHGRINHYMDNNRKLRGTTTKPAKKGASFRYYFSLTAAACIFLLFLIPALNQGLFNGSTIVDPHTKPEIDYVVPQKQMINYDFGSDDMDRGDHHYYKEELVIDPTYYETNRVARGDVILFKYPEAYDDYMRKINNINNAIEESISRIIALPGETIEIKSSQIYINGKKLDTFYGREHDTGTDLETYKQLLKDGIYRQNMKAIMKEMENNHLEKLIIPDGYVYMIGDNWWRSIDSNILGPIPIENIKGKVVGYKDSSVSRNGINDIYNTAQKPPSYKGELPANHLQVIEVFTDSMQRDGEFPKKVVVDETFEQTQGSPKEIRRGDIVYMEIPKVKANSLASGNAGGHIARVIGLPGEVLEIINGQVFINDMKLNTFYGHEYKWAGSSKAEKVTDNSRKAITIPKDSYFIIGDNWWKSPIHQPIPKEYIKGKVIGHKK